MSALTGEKVERVAAAVDDFLKKLRGPGCVTVLSDGAVPWMDDAVKFSVIVRTAAGEAFAMQLTKWEGG